MSEISLLCCIIILVSGCLYAQNKHYKFVAQEIEADHQKAYADEIDRIKHDLYECRKKVDGLTARAGLKL